MKLTNKRVIVTGGAGFIGSHVVDQLAAMGNEVVVVDNFSTGKRENVAHHMIGSQVWIEHVDVRDRETMMTLTRGADVVFHMAVACLRTSLSDPVLVHEVNATGTLSVCQASLESNVARLVYISSSEAYGSAAYVPMDEGHPLNPTTVYGASKAAGEHYALAYWRTYGLPALVIRPFNTYGPREHSEGMSAEVIPKFVMRVMAGLPPIIFSTGQQTRDFTWVEDTARGIIAAAECDALVGDCVNIARGQEVSIEYISTLVLEKLGRQDLQPVYVGQDRPGDVKRHYADTNKAEGLLGFSATVDINEGIDRYIQWVREQQPDLASWMKQEKVQNW